MTIIEEAIQNTDIIIGISLQLIALAFTLRFMDIVYLSIGRRVLSAERVSRRERAARHLEKDIAKRKEFVRNFIVIGLLIDMIIITIGRWYVFIIPIIAAWWWEARFFVYLQAHKYFNGRNVP